MIAGARLSQDTDYLQGLLATAEVVVSTVATGSTRHYLFAPLVGFAPQRCAQYCRRACTTSPFCFAVS